MGSVVVAGPGHGINIFGSSSAGAGPFFVGDVRSSHGVETCLTHFVSLHDHIHTNDSYLRVCVAPFGWVAHGNEIPVN